MAQVSLGIVDGVLMMPNPAGLMGTGPGMAGAEVMMPSVGQSGQSMGNGITLKQEMHSGLPPLDTNSLQLQQVIQNSAKVPTQVPVRC